ncbi:telomerase RNA component interacting RNase-like isoform X1 [Metopolophium dirhodum]|uniref:telomerase RNA component interacting RNase-like isoform X1 n=1 Tax=Metopolophium dirhodum TaxID=44670 RepID=UPI00298F853D|nr:telomerase RNA component interacting RNase-like isoform X1 [Metopolophium dirhodum]
MASYNNQQAQNAFKNDGSFLEVYQRFEQQQQQQQQKARTAELPILEVQVSQTAYAAAAATTTTTTTTSAVASEKRSETLKTLPIIGKRKNKALKTGVVKKVKPDDEKKLSKPTDAWSLYLDEVKRYQETVGEQDNKTRPLVK